MNDVRNQYIRCVKEKEKEFYILNAERISYLVMKYRKGEIPSELPMLIPLFNWLYEVSDLVDMVLLWGSYAKGREKDFSFNKHKYSCYEKNLCHGPSDVDCLIVSEYNLTPPKIFSKYEIYDRDFVLLGHEILDLYRDVFVCAEDDLFGLLNDSDYSPLYVYSYMNNGALIKSNESLDELFNLFACRSNYEEDARLLFEKKAEWFREIIV